MIRLIIFDFDGVLCPLNYSIILEVYSYIAQQMNLAKPWGNSLAEFKKWFSPIYPYNLERMGGGGPEQIHQAEQLFRDYLNSHRYHLFPEYEEILPQLQSQYLLAIVSNGPEDRAKLELQHRCNLFCSIIGRETLKDQFKPNPYGLQLCLERAQVAPDQAIIIGDDKGDIQAGINAGLRFSLGVSWGVADPQDLLAVGAHKILANPRELLHFVQIIK